MSDVPLDDLLREMGRTSVADEAPELGEARRARVVARMRERHVELVHERGRAAGRRPRIGWLLAAAVLALGATALAGVGGRGPLAPFFVNAHEESAAPSKTRALQPGNGVAVRVAPPEANAPAEASSPAPTTRVVPPAVAPRHDTDARPSPAPVRAPSAETELEVVNRLFASAKRARREHRDAEALALLQEILTQHPRSALAHEAEVERFRLAARLGRRADAERYAAAYLRRYPSGFGAAEARALLDQAP
jgi:hypothetical protein